MGPTIVNGAKPGRSITYSAMNLKLVPELGGSMAHQTSNIDQPITN
jgi:hypothetical protein